MTRRTVLVVIDPQEQDTSDAVKYVATTRAAVLDWCTDAGITPEDVTVEDWEIEEDWT